MTDHVYPKHLIDAIKSFYLNIIITLDLSGGMTKVKPTNKREKQGSPQLCSIYTYTR